MKTPGTSSKDDPSQQPRQTTTPTPREDSAIAKEDHEQARESLTSKERAPDAQSRSKKD
jgi:hypothetical protein